MTTLTRAVLTDDAMISCWICISSCVATCAVTSTRRLPLESFCAACILRNFFLYLSSTTRWSGMVTWVEITIGKPIVISSRRMPG